MHRGFAQDSTMQVVSVRFGINQLKEENLLPKVSTGTATTFGYGFEINRKNLQQFAFNFTYSRLKTKVEDLSKTINLLINAQYSTNFRLVNRKGLAYYLGPQATLNYNWAYFPNWDDSHFYWGNYLSVGISNVLVVKHKQNSWVTTLSLPLFSVFSRPELYRLYKIDRLDAGGIISGLHSHIKAAHLTNVLYASFATEYRFPAFKSKQHAFVYSFDYSRVKDNNSNPLNQITHRIGLKLYL